MLRFKNISQNNQGSTTQSGFTLVEISIVMIIIGLLIGGIFGGMKLVDNANVQKTVQDLKAIESATLTFRDTYRALPGDIRNPNTRIPNCTVAPCATGGNGDRRLDAAVNMMMSITSSNERFTFWSHLQSSDLLSLGTSNTLDMNFGEGQPLNPIVGGYRMTLNQGGSLCETPTGNTSVVITTDPNGFFPAVLLGCAQFESLDRKIDDGLSGTGLFTTGTGCRTTCDSSYINSGQSGFFKYDFPAF